ncbi:bifunctional phosphopantothenoylcysteine decarboxylase/phosphopantothenate--cysteine ligase CoaBC [Polyangium aurulentum]|uniref:bifunctional phosphopantothenoylcysteine decarboxylase/phosphopantothenate--cysteine ligase CoaBC n=1 Tax=Polyangium aurulentum TaxID=2567896 RepID=UPI0010AEC01F|nr:bifunctional phosphopantothenoylcysteine decarboxylase/phosphopantothenate--cysteine ligase CoaBC [Polyangium aurulentum]UQA61898.1 bifunctional phosphopantothenoylcysteine decarboxylase/phosphopantothenate--cysteine ligase CoaBC [Polyangium aurulentum]
MTPSSAPSARPTIVLAVSGSIAAYKAVEVARLLKKAGARVLPVMTRSAKEFLGPSTLSGICGEPVREDMWDPSYAGELHVELGRSADLVVIVPATADLLARLASGRADDLLTALALCARGPILAAPAMHPRMWTHPAVARNVATLRADGRVELIGPVEGEVASGERGPGRMAEPAEIAEAALARIGPRDLDGRRIVVTAGPTVEDLDPVRFLSNRSTGKMGFAIAERAAARGAEVTLVAGPVSLETPPRVKRVDVRGALSMRSALWEALGEKLDLADALIMTAAVADYRPAEESATKLKRSAEATALALVPNPDLLAEVGAARAGSRPVLVGFAVETADEAGVVAYARGKLDKKRVDLVVANHAKDSFGREDNRATIVTRDRAEALGVLPKRELADRILDRVAEGLR